MKPVVIFGTGKIAEAVSAVFTSIPGNSIGAYTCDSDHVVSSKFLGKPVVSFDEIENDYPPEAFDIFVAIGYQKLNSLREAKINDCKSRSYTITRCISPQSGVEEDICGENCFVAHKAIIQPGVSLGDNVFVWDGALIGHHSSIGANAWITGSAALGGGVTIEKNCFIGLNATIGHAISIGEKSLIGASTLVTRNLPAKSVVVAKDTDIHRLDSDQFLRLIQEL